MRIERADVFPVRLPLRAPLTTGRGPVAAREGVVVRLRGESGAEGWGEALPLAGFGLESLAQCRSALGKAVQRLGLRRLSALEALDAGDFVAAGAPAAAGALETALLDLAAREAGETLAAALGVQAPLERVAVCALLPGGSPEAVARGAARAVAQGFGALKLKVGHDLGLDHARVAAARRAAGPEVELRLDANGAWEESVALDALAKLAAFDVAFVEQPVAACDLDALARVRARAPIRVAADEAAADEASAHRVLERGAADLLVLKPAVAGGPRAARRIATRALSQEVPVVVTSFLDSVLGRAAALHVAASLGQPLPAAGLATGALLSDDLAPGLEPVGGEIALPGGAGLGVTPERDALERLSQPGAPS